MKKIVKSVLSKVLTVFITCSFLCSNIVFGDIPNTSTEFLAPVARSGNLLNDVQVTGSAAKGDLAVSVGERTDLGDMFAEKGFILLQGIIVKILSRDMDLGTDDIIGLVEEHYSGDIKDGSGAVLNIKGLRVINDEGKVRITVPATNTTDGFTQYTFYKTGEYAPESDSINTELSNGIIMSIGSLEGDDNPAFMVGTVPHRIAARNEDGTLVEDDPAYYSINESLADSFANDGSEAQGSVINSLERLDGVNYLDLLDKISDIVPEEDFENAAGALTLYYSKNGETEFVDSPALVLLDKDNHQSAHVGFRRRSVYVSEVLMRDIPDELKAALLIREAVLFYQMRKMLGDKEYSEDEIFLDHADYTAEEYTLAVIVAESMANDVMRRLAGGRYDEYTNEKVAEYIEELAEKLAYKNVIGDEVSHVLSTQQGRLLEGGKTYELGREWATDKVNHLRTAGVTGTACLKFWDENNFSAQIEKELKELDTSDLTEVARVGAKLRDMVKTGKMPADVEEDILARYHMFQDIYGPDVRLAIRSSNRAEDIELEVEELKEVNIGASAGQYDSFLGEKGDADVLRRNTDCFASTFNNEAMVYRDTMMVYLAFGDILPNAERTKMVIDRLRQKSFRSGTAKSAERMSKDKLVADALENPEENLKKISSMMLLRSLEANNYKGDLNAEIDAVEKARNTYTNVGDIAMSVTMMPMVKDVKASIVGFAGELNSGWSAAYFQDIIPEEYKNKGRVFLISANHGIGESIVQGKANADVFLVQVFQNDETGKEEIVILDRQKGTKMVQAVFAYEIMEELNGLTEDNAQDLLDAYKTYLKNTETGEKEEIGLTESTLNKLFLRSSSPVNLNDFFEVLDRLVKPKVEETADVEVSNDILNGLNINRYQLDKLAHLMKALKEDSRIRTMFTDVPEDMRDVFSVTDEEVRKIAKQLGMRGSHKYGKMIDFEGAIGEGYDGRRNVVTSVQRRSSNIMYDFYMPWLISEKYSYISDEELKKARKEDTWADEAHTFKTGELLIEGIPTRNAFSGMIYDVRQNIVEFQFNDDEKKKLEKHFEIIAELAKNNSIIIRTDETTPDYIPTLKTDNVNGVIASAGGPTSHAAVISRELGIATVVGIMRWLNELEAKDRVRYEKVVKYLSTNGNVVTVDANGVGRVFAGYIPSSKMKIEVDINRLPRLFTKIGYIMGLPHPMYRWAKSARYDGYGGVVLQRSEFIYDEEDIHPGAGVAFDNLLVYNYLRTGYDKGWYEMSTAEREYLGTLSEAEISALRKLDFELKRRKASREEGLDIPSSDIELMIERHTGDKIKNSRSSKKQSGIFLVRDLDKHEKNHMWTLKQYPDEVRNLSRKISGFPSYDEFFKAYHSGPIAGMAAANGLNNDVLVRSIDFKKNEARNLAGSVIFDPEPESATMIGERGARWLLKPENQVILKREIRTLLELVATGYTNLGYFFPFVSTPKELDKLLDILDEEEKRISEKYNRPIYLRNVGQMVELPSNVTKTRRFIKVLKGHEAYINGWMAGFMEMKGLDERLYKGRHSFFSFGTNDLTQTLLGADRDLGIMAKLFDEANPLVVEAIQKVVNESEKAGIPCELCGNALVNLATKNPAASERLLLSLGQTGGMAGTDALGTEIAIVRSASATLRHGELVKMEDQPKADNIETLVSADQFSSDLAKGAAARPLFHIEKVSDLTGNEEENIKEKTYIGDYALFDLRTLLPEMREKKLTFTETDGETGSTRVSGKVEKYLARLGSVIFYTDEIGEETDLYEDMIRALEILRVPHISLSGKRTKNLDGLREHELRRSDFIFRDMLKIINTYYDDGISGLLSDLAGNGYIKDSDGKWVVQQKFWDLPIPSEMKLDKMGKDVNIIEMQNMMTAFRKAGYVELIGDNWVITEKAKFLNDTSRQQLGKGILYYQKRKHLKDIYDVIKYSRNVTIDFEKQTIFRGDLDVNVVIEERESKIDIKERDTDVDVIEFDKAIKVNDFYTVSDALNRIHPASFMVYDSVEERKKLPEDVRKDIAGIMASTGKDSAKEAYKEILSRYIKGKMDVEKGQYVWETSDVEDDDFADLRGYEAFRKKEDKYPNPPLGPAGLYQTLIDPNFKALFMAEMEVIKDLLSGGVNISVQLNSVKIVDHLEEALEILAELGLDPAGNLQLGINTAWPSNYMMADALIKAGKLSFIRVDKVKLAQAELAAHLDGKNPNVSEWYTEKEIDEEVKLPVYTIKHAVNENDIALADIKNKDEEQKSFIRRLFDSVSDIVLKARVEGFGAAFDSIKPASRKARELRSARKKRDEARKAGKDDEAESLKDKISEISGKEIALYEGEYDQPRALVLYADDIIENGVVVDLERTLALKDASGKGILDEGQLILYTEEKGKDNDDVNNLVDLIETADPTVTVTVVDTSDLRAAERAEVRGISDLERNMTALKNIAQEALRGDSAVILRDDQILGIFRGSTGENNEIFEVPGVAKELQVPVVIFDTTKPGIFSFAEALQQAIWIRQNELKWYTYLKPVKLLSTEELRIEFEKYVHQILVKA